MAIGRGSPVWASGPSLSQGGGSGLGGGHGAGERDLGYVVDSPGEPPGTAAGRLELAEVRLPDAATARRRVEEHSTSGPGELASLRLVAPGEQEPASPQGSCHRRHRDVVAIGLEERPELAVAPGGEGSSIVGGDWLQRIDDGRRPASPATSHCSLPAVPGRAGNAEQGAESGDRERPLDADPFEVREAG